MEEWKEYKLVEVCDLIPGFAFKSKDFGEYATKAIKIKDIQPPIVDTNGADGVCIESYDKSKLFKYLVQKDDFILAMTGATIGKIGRYIDNTPAYLNQRVLKFAPKTNVDSNFIYYYVSTSLFQRYVINHVDSESAQPNISAKTIGKYPVLLPSLAKQQHIASVLKSLDDKIEVNRRINENLEQQAQALFKSWFVDFEPFRDGEFEDSELGMIPKGWRVDRIENFCDVFTGRKNVNESTAEGNYPFFSCSPTNTYSNDFVYDGEVVLIAGNGSYTGRTSYYIGKFDLYQRTYACVMKKDVSKEMSAFVYFMMKCFFEPQKMGGTRGSSIPYIVMNDITLQCFPFNNEIVMRFSSIAYDILLKTFENEQESRRLASLRDTLLPRLMSGELKVSDVTL